MSDKNNDKTELKNKILEGIAQLKSKKQIAYEIGITVSAIEYRIRNMRKQGIEVTDLKKEQDRIILERLDNKYSIKEIAEELGYTVPTIRKRIKKIQNKKIESQEEQEELEKQTKQPMETYISKENIIKELLQLKKTRNATDEQIKQLGVIFGITENDLSNEER